MTIEKDDQEDEDEDHGEDDDITTGILIRLKRVSFLLGFLV